MGEIDLDNVLNETRNTIRSMSDIDVDDKFSEISMGRIYYEIDELSKGMVQSDNCIQKKHFVKSVSYRETKIVKLLIKIDKRLRKISFYNNVMRPVLLKKARKSMDKKILKVRNLFKYNGGEYVDVLYRSILCREPDVTGRENAISYLQQPYIHKIDLLYNISISEEAREKNLIIKGIKSRRTASIILRKIYKLPIIGYITLLIINLCLLPRKLSNIQKSINGINSKITLLKNEFNTTDNQVSNYIDTIENIINKSDKLDKFFDEDNINKKENNARLKHEKEIMDRFYLRYNEILMPDSRETVKERARIYIEKLNEQFNQLDKEKLICIDLGCGEGEWIELLGESGYNGYGVDNNTAVVKKVRQSLPALNIIQMDAFQYLKTLDDKSIDLLTSFHMVEHLDMMELIDLLAECKRVLKTNGILIVETPNPQNIMISTYYFNMDPTHKKPIPPELLAFFISESELKIIDKILLYPLNFVPYEYKENDPIKDIVFRFNMEQAYSVMAVKE